MSKKHSSPALYEVIQGRTGAAAPSRRRPEPPPPPPTPPPAAIVRRPEGEGPGFPGGRALRVPVGYVWLAVSLAIVIIVCGYTIGYHRGGKAAQQAEGDQLDEALLAGGGGVQDPLQADDASGARSDAPDQNEEAVPKPPPKPPQGDRKQPKPTPNTGDPRTPGQNYFVIEQSTPDGAKALVAYCQGQGLDAHAVRGNNGPNKVIVLPGFAYAERETRTIKDLEAKIRKVGETISLPRTSRSSKADLSSFPTTDP
jgi:hypothetical protein